MKGHHIIKAERILTWLGKRVGEGLPGKYMRACNSILFPIDQSEIFERSGHLFENQESKKSIKKFQSRPAVNKARISWRRHDI